MEAKRYNDVSKLIVPLISADIDVNDLSNESGFVNAYTDDINRPSMCNHIFLLYDSKVVTVESEKIFRKFTKMKDLFNYRFCVLNNHSYIVYAFSRIPNKVEIRNVLNGSGCISANAKLKIYDFWKSVTSESYGVELFLPHFRFCEPVKETMPEEDYCHSFFK